MQGTSVPGSTGTAAVSAPNLGTLMSVPQRSSADRRDPAALRPATHARTQRTRTWMGRECLMILTCLVSVYCHLIPITYHLPRPPIPAAHHPWNSSSRMPRWRPNAVIIVLDHAGAVRLERRIPCQQTGLQDAKFGHELGAPSAACRIRHGPVVASRDLSLTKEKTIVSPARVRVLQFGKRECVTASYLPAGRKCIADTQYA